MITADILHAALLGEKAYILRRTTGTVFINGEISLTRLAALLNEALTEAALTIGGKREDEHDPR